MPGDAMEASFSYDSQCPLCNDTIFREMQLANVGKGSVVVTTCDNGEDVFEG